MSVFSSLDGLLYFAEQKCPTKRFPAQIAQTTIKAPVLSCYGTKLY